MQKIPSNTFIPLHPLKTAVLFLVFNRPDTTKQVFEAIRKAKPPRLYVAADGPRADKPGEVEKVEQARRIATEVDWDCEVKTLLREKNLGCRVAVSSAIDWFFEHVEEGIILEDDCLPSKSFFQFCDELLAKYHDDNRVMHISGFNPLVAYQTETSYCFSRFGPIWGWASWRRAWKDYDVNMSSWQERRPNLLRDGLVQSEAELRWRQSIFDKVYYNKLGTWDYQWSYAKLLCNGLSIMPRVSLISNIGFLTDSTHTSGKAPDHFLRNYELDFPLSHPLQLIEDQRFGDAYLEHFAMPSQHNMFKRIGRRIVSMYRGKYTTRKKWNVVLDEKIRPLEKIERSLIEDECFQVIASFDQSSDRFWYWLGKAKSAFLNYRYPHKKALEFFFSAKLLDIRTDDIVLDAAGGRSEYLSQIKDNTRCRNLYLNDQIYAENQPEVDGIRIVGGDVTTIAMPDCSVTKIACHHAIEHFGGDKDIKFVLEVSRLLRSGGIACVIPLFLSDIYAEIWNIEPETCYDARALCIVDRTASLPGAHYDGHFARVYDCQALIERVLKTAACSSLTSKIVECTLDGRAIPDMSINFGSKINRPLRALVFYKV